MGCGGDAGGGTVAPFSCVASFPDGGVSAPILCVDIAGGTEQDLENNRKSCATQGNQLVMQPCPHAKAIGGCRLSRGGLSVTTWYYDDGSGFPEAPDIQQGCLSIGVAFVTP
jgi:hypothetical protein